MSAGPEPEVGERMLLPCTGGPSQSRLVRYPPPLEIEERDGTYVLVDDGPPPGVALRVRAVGVTAAWLRRALIAGAATGLPSLGGR